MSGAKTAESPNGAMSPDAMRAALLADRQERAQACLAEIRASLRKYRCELVSVAYLEDGRILARADVLAAE